MKTPYSFTFVILFTILIALSPASAQAQYGWTVNLDGSGSLFSNRGLNENWNLAGGSFGLSRHMIFDYRSRIRVGAQLDYETGMMHRTEEGLRADVTRVYARVPVLMTFTALPAERWSFFFTGGLEFRIRLHEQRTDHFAETIVDETGTEVSSQTTTSLLSAPGMQLNLRGGLRGKLCEHFEVNIAPQFIYGGAMQQIDGNAAFAQYSYLGVNAGMQYLLPWGVRWPKKVAAKAALEEKRARERAMKE